MNICVGHSSGRFWVYLEGLAAGTSLILDVAVDDAQAVHVLDPGDGLFTHGRCCRTLGHRRATYIHTYIHTCMHAYTHTYIYTHIYTYVYIYTHVYIYIHTYTYTYIYIYRQERV